MKALLSVVVCLAGVLVVAHSSRASQEKVEAVIAVLGQGSRAEVNNSLVATSVQALRSCPTCRVVDITPYDEKGQSQARRSAEALKSLPAETRVLVMSWNAPLSSEFSDLRDQLRALADRNVLILGPAGYPERDQASHSLAHTVLGSIERVIIIGEIGESEGLHFRSFYGPQILTAVRAPASSGQGLFAFLEKLGPALGDMKVDALLQKVRVNKLKSKRMWPSFDELLSSLK